MLKSMSFATSPLSFEPEIKTFSHIVTIDRSRLSMLIIWGHVFGTSSRIFLCDKALSLVI